MNVRFITCSSVAVLLALASVAQAQTTAKPDAAPMTAPMAAPAPVPSMAPAPAAAPAAAATTAAPTTAVKAMPATAAATGETFEGKLAYYGNRFKGRKTASGERFNPNAFTMAHKTLPFGTLVKVTNPANNRSVTVRVNDRGPSTPDRVGDVTTAAAYKLRMVRSGVIEAKFEVVGMSKRRYRK